MTHTTDELRRQLEDERGCVVILWTVDDMPGATRDIREKRFTEIASELEARCTEAGSELLSLMFSRD